LFVHKLDSLGELLVLPLRVDDNDFRKAGFEFLGGDFFEDRNVVSVGDDVDLNTSVSWASCWGFQGNCQPL